MLKIGVLGSGKGSNFQSIIDAVRNGSIDAEIRCVVSDVEDAFILKRSANEGIPSKYIDCSSFKTKIDGEAAQKTLDYLEEYEVDFVALAGFMRIVKDPLLSAYSGRMINIHPSLLPSFPGLESWRKALDYGVKITGCTVHFIDAGVDTGPIILQRSVKVYDDDTPPVLHARIQEQEHIAYPQALQLIANGNLV